MKKNDLSGNFVEKIRNALAKKNKTRETRVENLHALVGGRKMGKSTASYYIDEWIDENSPPSEKIVVNLADLEKYPALKSAYEHYRMMEKLCIGGKRIE